MAADISFHGPDDFDRPKIEETNPQIAPSQNRPQMDSGLASLVTLLQFHDIPANAEAISREYSPDGRAMDNLSIVRAAKAKGLKARKSKSKLKRLDRLPLPVIAKKKDGSYFVLAKYGKNSVLVQEAGRPPAEWTLDELKERWSGQVILMARRAGAGMESVKFGLSWFLPVIWKYRNIFSEVLVASFFLQLFALMTPIFFQVIIDKVLVHRGLTTLDVLIIGMICVIFFEVILGGLRTYIFSHTTSRIDAQLGAKLFRHLLALPVAYFENRPTGQTVARVRELENVRDFITGNALTVTLDLAFTFVFFAVMYHFSPTLTFIVLGSLPFYFLLSIAITPSLRKRIEERFKRGAANQALLVENIAGVETLKAMAVEPQMCQRWEEQLASYVKASFRTVVLGTFGSQAVTLINKIVVALILWFGARQVIAGDLSIGQLVAFNMLSGHVNGPIIRLAQLWQDFQQFRISVARLGDVLNTKTETQSSATHPNLPPIKGDISFDHVSFRYKPDLPLVLNDVSLHIKAGQIIGVVGRSGSGKSTFTKLLQRLHVPESGRIIVDGVDISLLDTAWLRRQIGVVLQDNVLFNRSVRDNIALSDPAMPMEKVIEVARLSGAHEFVQELSQGYDTELEERGSNLSGGQRQRLAIARALAIDPRILVFDEATSALDYESEKLIQDNMQKICHNRTVFIVAHRLSTVRIADRILVMEEGKIVEDGSHDELLALKGIYAQLVSKSRL